jgi:hypothetical protein
LQDEITSQIANALDAALIAAEASRPTGHAVALDYFLRSRAVLSRQFSPETYAHGIHLLE